MLLCVYWLVSRCVCGTECVLVMKLIVCMCALASHVCVCVPAVVRGDCDSANFMFHSEHISSTRWGNTRCGDFRTISALSNLLHMRWLNRVVIAANPMRLALGGLGLRGEFNSKVKYSAIDTNVSAVLCCSV